MSPLDDNLGRSRTLIASYGLVMAAVVFAIAVVIVMNRFHGLLDEELDLVEVQYEEALQYSELARHIQLYAQQSAEVLARSGEIEGREEHAQAARRILA